MLDMECFTYLNRALESPMSPYVVLASNRGISTIRGTEYDGVVGGSGEGIRSPHGIPVDLLDRCMIVKTSPYIRDEIRKVVELRCKVEGISVKPDALEKLADEGEGSSLRYALQLLTPAMILARGRGSTEVGVEDVEELGDLFLDAKKSTAVLREWQ
jgi:RuvB-like protein 1 (pontin 52)